MHILQSFTLDELTDFLLEQSLVRDRATHEIDQKKSEKRARYRAKQIFHWVYQRFVFEWDEMTDLSKDLRKWLKTTVRIHQMKVAKTEQSQDGTRKYLWALDDRKTVESVIIPAALSERGPTTFSGEKSEDELDSDHWNRLTVCISSQVGCAMACKFCLTGVQGFDRHLEIFEIVSQVLELRRVAPLTNIVFMGMGEPFHNIDNILKACEILIDEDGLNFSRRRITVSTSGIVPALERYGKEARTMIAISLNATTDEQRNQIMPVNRKWNIAKLLDTCRQIPLDRHRRITFEYVMLRDFNDSDEDAKRITKLLRGIPSKINLIPFNEHPGSEFKRPDDQRVRQFQRIVTDAGYTCTVRISRGRDISAACGQLRSIFGSAKGTDRHQDENYRAARPI